MDRRILAQRRMREVVEEMLALADDLKAATIEALLAKSDFDLGTEALFGGRILNQRPPRPSSARAREAAPRRDVVVRHHPGQFPELAPGSQPEALRPTPATGRCVQDPARIVVTGPLNVTGLW